MSNKRCNRSTKMNSQCEYLDRHVEEDNLRECCDLPEGECCPVPEYYSFPFNVNPDCYGCPCFDDGDSDKGKNWCDVKMPSRCKTLKTYPNGKNSKSRYL